MRFAIKYRGILTDMYVTGFSEPMDVGTGEMERSVNASSRIDDAAVFDESSIDEALALARRPQPTAERVQLEGNDAD